LFSLFPFLAAGCGGSDGDDSDGGGSETAEQQVPVSVSISEPMTAGVPLEISYTIPAASTPVIGITINLKQTLQSANIRVTP
jgi:hypothetical protein